MIKILNNIRYRLARIVRRLGNKIAPYGTSEKISYKNLGAEKLPQESPRALIFFVVSGIQRMVEGKNLDEPIFKRHTIPFDGISMVKELNKQGYIVDYCDLWRVTGKDVDWSKYKIVIDNADNLKYAPNIPGQVLINFTNYNHWLFNNTAELERIKWFKNRTGILIPANRAIPSFMSDQYAHYLTYYGTNFQIEHYSSKPKKFHIGVCGIVGEIPTYNKKDINISKNKFIWLGGGGMLYKGADIAMEAFKKIPEANLYICGNLEEEKYFWDWAKKFIAETKNINYMGWMDTTSNEFNELANKCIGIVYPSSTEGGPGSVARVMFNGLIPIVTKSSNVQGEDLGIIIEGKTDTELINSVISNVKKIMTTDEKKLEKMSDEVRNFAIKNHTRESFNKRFSELIKEVSK